MAPRNWRVAMGLLVVLLCAVAGGCEGKLSIGRLWRARRLQASFSLEKTDHFLGEPIFAVFSMTNRGSKPFAFLGGGSCGGTCRHEDFSFSALSESGKQVRDPGNFCGMGRGFHTMAQIKPKETHTGRLLVNLWCAFTEPGRYTITCKRTLYLGWKSRSSVPSVTFERKLVVTIRADEEALVRYAEQLAAKLAQGGDNEHIEDMMCAYVLARHASVLPIAERLARAPGQNQHLGVLWLNYFGQTNTTPILLDIVRGPNPKARSYALGYLQQRGAEGVGALVRDALRSEDVGERRYALTLCTQDKYPECLPVLIDMLKGEAVLSPVEITKALRRTTGQMLGRDPADWIAWWEREGKK